MAHSKNFPSLTMPTTSYQKQVQRQRIGEHWRPNGIERYEQTVQELDGMPVLGSMGQPGYAPRRFQPVGPLEADNPIGERS